MKTRNLLFVLILSLASIASSRANLVDVWNIEGTWAALNADIGEGSGATITASGHGSGYPSEMDGLLYTFFNAPTFTVSTSNVLTDITSISLSIFSSAAPLNVSLDFNGENVNLVNYVLTTESGQTLGEGTGFATPGINHVYTWDVSGLGTSNGFSVTWNLGTHVAFDQITLTQTAAVPEPSTYAAIVGGLALVGVMILRRRKA